MHWYLLIECSGLRSLDKVLHKSTLRFFIMYQQSCVHWSLHHMITWQGYWNQSNLGGSKGLEMTLDLSSSRLPHLFGLMDPNFSRCEHIKSDLDLSNVSLKHEKKKLKVVKIMSTNTKKFFFTWGVHVYRCKCFLTQTYT